MRRNTRRLPALLLVILLFLGMLPATALAANFPSKFYAHLMNKSGMGTVNSSLNYTSMNSDAQQVHGMEYAGGVFFTVVGNKDDDGWRELRMYNSDLTNPRTIGTVNNANGGYWIIDTAMDLSGTEPALYGTYNTVIPDVIAMSMICTIDLETATPGSYLQVTGLPDMHIIYAIAFDKEGTLYAIGADAGANGGPASLYTINKASGAATLVGAIKTSSGNTISTNYCQDLAFDHATNTLYWAENDENVLYTLDITTAVAKRQGQVKYSNIAYPIQSFCIPYDTTFGQNKDQYMVSVICEGAGNVTCNGENKPFYMVNKGGSITLNIEFNEGGTSSDLLGVTVDGNPVSISSLENNSYTFDDVTGNHVIEVKLKKEIPAEQNTVTWLHYQGEPASFYTVDNVYKFYELPYLDKDVPREGYTQTLLDEKGDAIDGDEIIIPGNYDVHVTHPGNEDYAALDVTYTDALQLAKCPGTPGRPVVYGKVGCTQADLVTTSALQDYYRSDGTLIDAAHDEIPVTLEWLEPEKRYDTAGNFSASATIYAAQNLDPRLKACYTLDDGVTPLTEGCQISPRATQVVVLPEDEASLIKLQTSDASGGTVSGKGVYKNGTEVTVTAAVNANDGYEFKGWQEGENIVSEEATYTFDANSDRTLTALFEVNEDYWVILKTDPQDGGTVTGGGSYKDEPDHKATVTATANPGYYFMSWYQGDELVTEYAEHDLSVPETGITLTAKFGIDYLARAEQARTNFESALGTDVFEWETLVQAVDAYEAAADFVENPPSGITDAQNRYDALTTYYNGIQALDLSDQDIGNDDLTELYLFTGVTDLNLGGNKGIADLSALKELAELETLDISGTGVTALDSLVPEDDSSFPGYQNLTAKNLTLNSVSALAQLVGAEGFAAGSVTNWDFTGSTLPDTEGSKTDVEAIQTALGDKFTPPTIRTTPAPAPTPAEHAIVVAETEHGKVTAEPAKAAEGVSVTVTVTPDEGYKLETLTVTDANGAKLELTDKGDGRFEFSMPDCDVSVGAAFVPLRPDYASCTGGTDCPVSAFPDADPTEWYHDGIHFCLDNGMIGGYDNGLMGPHDSLSRAMMVRILFNYEGHPEVSESAAFDDVPDGTWYTDAVNWAAKNGVVEGYGDGRYGPADPITREQLATILYRYAKAKGFDTSVGEETNVLSYSDAGEISEFAMPAMQWACGSGVVEGYDGALRPQSGATRAEAATMLMRFCELYG